MEHDPSLAQSHNHHHHQPTAPPHVMIMPPGNSYHPHHHYHPQGPTTLSNAAPQQQQQLLDPNSTAVLQNNHFPFNSIVSGSAIPNSSSKPFEPLNSPYSGDGSSALRSGSAAADGNGGMGGEVNPAKKKRGRPRKYPTGTDDGNIALGLTPNPSSAHGDSADTPPSSGTSSSKKHRGRPAGSAKRQLDALGNCGVGFTPHVILVNAGEDVAAKLVAFSQQGPRTVCILSANGSIGNVTLRQSSATGGGLRYEGRFEIISLTGSFLLSGGNGEQQQVKTAGLSISLAGPDGRVLGGGVAGMLIAASQVQIIVGSFVADGKKSKYMASVPESRILHFGAPSSSTLSSSPSQREGVSSESSEEDGRGTPHHLGQQYSQQQQQQPQQPQQQQQQFHMQQMYSAMGWANPGGTTKMLHH